MTDARAAIATHTGKRAGRSGFWWGCILGSYVAASAYGYAGAYPTRASRVTFAAALGGNAGIDALLGPAHRLDLVTGYTAWRSMGVLTVVGAIWGLFLATRLTRGEEDDGRWELLLAGATTRGGAAGQALAGLVTGLAVLWAVTASFIASAGLSSTVRIGVGASLYFGAALTAGATLFVAVGLLSAQLATTRRQANAIGAGVLALAFLVRMVADSGAGLGWLRWASPLGWIEELRPLTGSRPAAAVPLALACAAMCVAAVAVAGRRDVDAAVLPSSDRAAAHTRLLRSPGGLTVRLTRGLMVGWGVILTVTGVVLGLVAQSAAGAISGSAAIQRAIARLGGHRSGAGSYLGFALVIAASLIAFAAAGLVASVRAEEAQGFLDHLLVRPVARARWLGGRLGVAAAFVVVAGVVTGAAAWLGAGTQHTGVGFGTLVAAGVNTAFPALFVLGAGCLLFAVAPRRTAALTYGIVGWSLLVELIASVSKSNRWLLDTSVISHIAPAPATNPNWGAGAWLLGLGATLAAAGVLAFGRRDLAVD